ncbi:MAG: hypothetical protein ACRD4I_10520, partial [Candidatus Angelobacter sp.]
MSSEVNAAARKAAVALLNVMMSSNLPTRTSESRAGTAQENVSDVLFLRRCSGHGHQVHDLPSAVPHIAPLTSHLLPDLVISVLH